MAELAMYEFHWVDYLVFAASLVIGLVVGLIFFCKERLSNATKDTEDYLRGGGNMNVIMVGTSMLVSILNAVYLLGGTAEYYAR